MIIPFDDAYFMRQALIEAEKAFHEGEVPVGAVVVANQQSACGDSSYYRRCHPYWGKIFERLYPICNSRTLLYVRWRIILEPSIQNLFRCEG